MNLNFFYVTGIFLLFFGLLWLHIPELLEHGILEKNKISTTSNLKELSDKKILFYSLLGAFPTVLGILMIEYSNRKKKKLITTTSNKYPIVQTNLN